MKMIPVTTRLLSPVVSISRETQEVCTIPAGADVEYESSNVALGVAVVQWCGQIYLTVLQDLLDASSIADVANSAWPR